MREKMKLGASEEEEKYKSRTVVVGVKLDQPSKELLTWALVNVSQPGDRVIALHVLNSNEFLDKDGQSSLLSLVKAFDSVLGVYEGFCNLKQVDLKLKICRGSSIKKALVREAKSYGACMVILGAYRVHQSMGSSASVAKYCGRKLPSDCWLLAVNNGKVVFQREATTRASGIRKEGGRRPGLLGTIHRTLSKNSKASNTRVLEHPKAKEPLEKKEDDQESLQALPTVSESNNGLRRDTVNNKNLKTKCPICAPFSILPDEFLCHGPQEPCDSSRDQSSQGPACNEESALVATESLLIKEVPQVRAGLPLLHRAVRPNWSKISVVEQAMRLPSRHSAAAVHPDRIRAKSEKLAATNLDGENGAMVLYGNPTSLTPDSENMKISIKELESLYEKYSSTCRLFNYQELVQATCNFSTVNLIGKGGSSKVYKGHLPDGIELAVKILKPSDDVVTELVLEIEIITTLTHKNILSLFGFCIEDNTLLLVYDFLSRGSLEENLHDEEDRAALTWEDRYNVALGVAEALDYLHSRSVKPVIHRDVKSSNILLSDDFEPQLSDFGLAKWMSTPSAPIACSDVAGTFGYLAPEYLMYGKVTDKIDVYAFGVVLLELLTGRKPINNQYPKGQESLVMWAKPILQSGKYMQLLDPSLADEVDSDQMERMVTAISLCIREEPRSRPHMSRILKLLQGDEEVPKWAKEQLNSSDELDALDEDAFPYSNIQSLLDLALLDIEGDSPLISSREPSIDRLTADESLEEYLQ